MSTTAIRKFTGTGSPEGVQTAPPGSTYYQSDASIGNEIWDKATGTGNTGWRVRFTSVLNPQWFGARCDGSTDDTIALQATIDYAAAQNGGVVSLPPGTTTMISSITAKSGVTITGNAGTHGYPPTSARAAGLQAISTATGYMIDTPTSQVLEFSVTGLDIMGNGLSGAGNGGVRLRAPYGGAIKNVAFDQFQNEAIVTGSSGTSVTIEDVLVINSLLNRTRAAKLGAVDIDGTDHYVSRLEASPSLSAISSSSLYLSAIYVRGSNNFLTSCVGEFADEGVVVAGDYNRLAAVRADNNFGNGFNISNGRNMFSSCTSLDNGKQATNTYDGFVVSGFGNVFSACDSARTAAGTHRYGFNDTVDNSSVANRNSYVGCVSSEYGTAPFRTDTYSPSAPIWSPHALRISDATTVPDVGQSSFVVLSDYVTPTTVTNFANATSGQTIRILGSSNVTIANNANIQTRTGANRTLVSVLIYQFTYFDGIWYEAA